MLRFEHKSIRAFSVDSAENGEVSLCAQDLRLNMDSTVTLNSYTDVSNRKLLGGKLILALLAIEYIVYGVTKQLSTPLTQLKILNL